MNGQHRHLQTRGGTFEGFIGVCVCGWEAPHPERTRQEARSAVAVHAGRLSDSEIDETLAKARMSDHHRDLIAGRAKAGSHEERFVVNALRLRQGASPTTRS